jgi:AcrR family transcriptional regulator
MSPRKLEIHQVAATLMRHKGYANTTVRDIASEMNMEAASLYNHIASKEEILSNICFQFADQLEQGILEINDIYFNAKEKLKMAITQHILLLTQDLDASYVFIHEWKYLTADKKEEFITRRDVYEKQFRDIVVLGENEGAFLEVDQKFAVITILSAINATIEWYKPSGSLTPQQVAHKLTNFILTGLSNPHH